MSKSPELSSQVDARTAHDLVVHDTIHSMLAAPTLTSIGVDSLIARVPKAVQLHWPRDAQPLPSNEVEHDLDDHEWELAGGQAITFWTHTNLHKKKDETQARDMAFNEIQAFRDSLVERYQIPLTVIAAAPDDRPIHAPTLLSYSLATPVEHADFLRTIVYPDLCRAFEARTSSDREPTRHTAHHLRAPITELATLREEGQANAEDGYLTASQGQLAIADYMRLKDRGTRFDTIHTDAEGVALAQRPGILLRKPFKVYPDVPNPALPNPDVKNTDGLVFWFDPKYWNAGDPKHMMECMPNHIAFMKALREQYPIPLKDTIIYNPDRHGKPSVGLLLRTTAEHNNEHVLLTDVLETLKRGTLLTKNLRSDEKNDGRSGR